jgi:hypothetical protein
MVSVLFLTRKERNERNTALFWGVVVEKQHTHTHTRREKRNHKIKTTKGLLLYDLAARDLAATSTSIFHTGSSSTAKRLGRRGYLPPTALARRELNRTEPEQPTGQDIRTNRHTSIQKEHQHHQITECVFSSRLLFFSLLQQQKHTILLPRTSHALLERQTDKTSFPFDVISL